MDRIQLRRDSSENWKKYNPVLMEGEVGYETDTRKRKIGDGHIAWNDLEYLVAENIAQELGDGENIVISQKVMTELIDEGYLYKGIANTTTNITEPTGKIFYIVTSPGTYIGFNNIVIDGGLNIVKWNGTSWVKDKISLDVTKEQIDAIDQKISDLNSNTGISEYEQFNTSKAYAVGDVVSYMNKLYKFIVPHSAGAWDESQVESESLNKQMITVVNTTNGNSYYIQRLYELSNIKIELEDYTLVYAIIDSNGNIAWGITEDGEIIENIPKSTNNAINKLRQELINILQPKDNTRDDLFGVVDENNNPAVLLDKNGTFHVSFIKSHMKNFYIVDENGNIGFWLDSQGKLHTSLYKENSELIYPEYQIPECIFTVVNSCYSDKVQQIVRNYVPQFRIERITSDNVLIGNGGRSIPLVHCFTAMPSGDVSSLTISNKLCGKGYDDVDFSFNLYSIKNSVLLNKDIRLLCLGDSLTNADLWTSYIGKLIHMDNIDYKKKMSISEDKISYRPIGTMSNGGGFCDFTYRNEVVDFTDYNEGRSSWAAATYLRHATLFTWATVEYKGESKSIKHIAWHVLGLFEKEKVEYLGTEEQNNMIRYTCNGQYPITVECLDGWVWNKFRDRCGFRSVEYDDANDEQKNTMIHWLDGSGENNLLDNPDNPFFSKEKVLETKDADNCYAFDWETYYNRFKTHADDGSELEEKGTNYKSNSYVCVPNYIAMNLGTNDGTFGLTDEDSKRTLEDVYKIASLLKESTGAKVMIFQNAYPSASFPELSNEQNLAISIKQNASKDYFLKNKILMEICGSLQSQKSRGIFYCPSFFLQRQSCNYDRQYVEIGTEETKGWIVANGDVHPNKLGYADIGYEVYSMLCYLLTI